MFLEFLLNSYSPLRTSVCLRAACTKCCWLGERVHTNDCPCCVSWPLPTYRWDIIWSWDQSADPHSGWAAVHRPAGLRSSPRISNIRFLSRAAGKSMEGALPRYGLQRYVVVWWRNVLHPQQALLFWLTISEYNS